MPANQVLMFLGKEVLWGLSSLAVFLILIASVNFINLSTAQAMQRQKEIGVRKAIGSTKGQLFFQFMSETFLLALIAGFLSVNGLYCLLWIVNQKLSFIDLNLTPNTQTWFFGAGLIGIITLLAGSYPAFVLSGFKPAMAIKNNVQHEIKRNFSSSGTYCFSICNNLLPVGSDLDFFGSNVVFSKKRTWIY